MFDNYLDGSSLPMDKQLCWPQKHEVLFPIRDIYRISVNLFIPSDGSIILPTSINEETKITYELVLLPVCIRYVHRCIHWRTTFCIFYMGAMFRTGWVSRR